MIPEGKRLLSTYYRVLDLESGFLFLSSNPTSRHFFGQVTLPCLPQFLHLENELEKEILTTYYVSRQLGDIVDRVLDLESGFLFLSSNPTSRHFFGQVTSPCLPQFLHLENELEKEILSNLLGDIVDKSAGSGVRIPLPEFKSSLKTLLWTGHLPCLPQFLHLENELKCYALSWKDSSS